MPIQPMVPGGPAPEMPQTPPTDPSQMPPEDPSQAPAMPGATQSVLPQQKQALLDMINNVRAKLQNFSAQSFANKNKIESVRSTLLKQVFEKLQMAGVDLTDRDSVAAFLQKLQQTNPELAANFEKAMDVLLGGGFQGAPEDPSVEMDLGVLPQNNMNNENQNDQTQTSQNIPQG